MVEYAYSYKNKSLRVITRSEIKPKKTKTIWINRTIMNITREQFKKLAKKYLLAKKIKKNEKKRN